MKYGLTTGLVIASFILGMTICFFIFGYVLCQYYTHDRGLGLLLIIGSAIVGIIATACMIKWKTRLNVLLDYGDPVFAAADKIKDIIQKVNVFGVESLQGIIEKAVKEEMAKIAKQEAKK